MHKAPPRNMNQQPDYQKVLIAAGRKCRGRNERPLSHRRQYGTNCAPLTEKESGRISPLPENVTYYLEKSMDTNLE